MSEENRKCLLNRMKVYCLVIVLLTMAAVIGYASMRVHKNSGLGTADAVRLESYSTTNLLYMCDTFQEAENIANLYGINLERFNDGIAVYSTNRKMEEVIEEGKRLNYPPLYKDEIRTSQ